MLSEIDPSTQTIPMARINDLCVNQDVYLDIFQYDNYRDILRDYFHKCKEIDRRYSFRHFAKRLDVSHGYIQKLLEDTAVMPDKLLNGFVEIMGLEHESHDYFELLVRIERCDAGSTMHKKYQQRLESLRQKQLEFGSVDEEQLRCLTSWVHLVVLEMILLRGANFNLQWFKRCILPHFPITTIQIATCIEDLKRAQLLHEEDYELKRTEPLISFEDSRFAEFIRFYHREAMKYGAHGLSTPGKEREYSAFLIATTPEKLQQVKHKLRSDVLEAFQMLETPPEEATLLASLSAQLFPVAETE